MDRCVCYSRRRGTDAARRRTRASRSLVACAANCSYYISLICHVESGFQRRRRVNAMREYGVSQHPYHVSDSPLVRSVAHAPIHQFLLARPAVITYSTQVVCSPGVVAYVYYCVHPPLLWFCPAHPRCINADAITACPRMLLLLMLSTLFLCCIL